MNIGIPREIEKKETRVPVIPATAKRLSQLGATVLVERGIGASCGIGDEQYEAAGAQLVERKRLLAEAELVLRINKPPVSEIAQLRPDSVHISRLDPFREQETVNAFAERGIAAISMDMIPRITRAQKMDSLSSQANIAGYVAVILAAERLNRILPMMVTPAGTLSPAKVFVIGAGVAGLQAIATAHRLGARVEAFDTRPVVEEQVQSLGAKFVKIDLGETGQTKDGYAKALTADQIAKQQEAMARHCAQSDVVITAAQVFGKKAPILVTAAMLAQMAPGSIVVDMAMESGGNVEGAKLDAEIQVGGATVIGYANLAGRVPVHASQMYSANIGSFVETFWNKDSAGFVLDDEDEIIRGCLLTKSGQVWNERIKEVYAA